MLAYCIPDTCSHSEFSCNAQLTHTCTHAHRTLPLSVQVTRTHDYISKQ
uniref:Uncharacterized protein n=1 Tax=Anguilla anguilla TaxID=7936 RepID=A0A0E9WAB4_ANGAN